MVIARKARFLVVWLIVAVATAVAAAKDSYFDRQLDREIALLENDIDKPEAFLHIYSIWGMADFARWDGRIPNVLDEVLNTPTASPLLKSYSLWFLREVDLRKGDFDAAREKQAKLGFITDWFIIGPFDNEGMAGFDIAYPPEEAINLEETHDGKVRPVAWRMYPKVSYDCTVDLAATFRPNAQTAAYALAYVLSPEQRPIAVRLGADDCAKVWLGNQLIYSNRDRHAIGFDQGVASATLEKGWNRLLLKVCQEEDSWQFRVRITTPDGSALPGLEFADEKDEFEAALKVAIAEPGGENAAAPAQETPVADPIAAFEKLVEAHPDNAEDHAALSFLYLHANAFDRETRAHLKELETAAGLAPQEWKYQFRLGELYTDANKKRDAYERVIKLNPEHAPSYSRLGEHYSERNLDRKSIRFFRQAVERDASYYPGVLGLAEWLRGSSQRAKAAKLMKDTLHAFPDTPRLLSFAVGFSPFPVSSADSEKRIAAALRWNYSDRSLRGKLLSNYHARNDLESAISQIETIEQISPMDTAAVLDHARLLAVRGKSDEAMSLVDRALMICPEDDQALKEKGELFLRKESRDEALAWLQKSYLVKPQNAALRQYIEFLKPKEKPFEDDYKVDAARIIEEAPEEIGEAGDAGAYLFDLWIREVHANGLSNSYHQEIVRILTEAGVENFRIRRATYRPDTHELQVKAARVFKKDGRIINAEGPFTRQVGGEERIYYDLEMKYVGFSNLEPGDTIEFSYRVNAITPRNMYGDYFGDIIPFNERVPKSRMQYVVIAPPERELYYNVVGMEADPVIQTKDNARVYMWELKDLPKYEPEPYMPGYSDVLPYVHISTYRDWKSVADWYWNLIRDQLLLDSGTIAEVANITRGLESEREKIVAVYNYVVQNTRYIGLEFGIHSHKPYPAYKVHARKYGDCKDKAGLMVAMLREIGVDSCMAVVRTKSRGGVEAQPASLAVFNHVICYVPKYDLWLDGTAEYSGSAELPYEDQGINCMLVGKDVRKFVITPVLGSESNLMSEEYEARIRPDGGIEFKLNGEVVGQYAPYFRSRYQEEKDRENSLMRTWGRALPNISISEIAFENLKDREKPVRYSFKAFAPNYVVTDQSGGVGFTGIIQKLYLTQRYASLSKRKYDLELPFPWSLTASVTFALPPDFRVTTLPEAMHLQTEFGKCDVEFTSAEPTSVKVGFHFSFDASRVKVEQYEAFRDFCRLVDEKQAEKIRIAR